MNGYWDFKDVEEYTKIPENTLRSYVRKKTMPFIKVPGSSHIRFLKEHIDKWLLKGFHEADAEQEEQEDGKTLAKEG